MATIRSYTTIEQSKALAKILPLESADMWYEDSGLMIPRLGHMPKEHTNTEVPCWSLAALLDILDYPQLSKDKLGSGKVGWMVSVYPNVCRYESCWHDNPVDACYELLLKLNEVNLL